MVVGIVVKITLFSSPMGVIYRRASCHPIVVQTSDSADSYWEIQPAGDGAACFLQCPQRGEALPRALSNPFLDVHLLGEAADYLIGQHLTPTGKSLTQGQGHWLERWCFVHGCIH